MYFSLGTYNNNIVRKLAPGFIISGEEVLQTVPDWQEGHSNKETEGASLVGQEWECSVGPDFSLGPDLAGGESEDEQEVAVTVFSFEYWSCLSSNTVSG